MSKCEHVWMLTASGRACIRCHAEVERCDQDPRTSRNEWEGMLMRRTTSVCGQFGVWTQPLGRAAGNGEAR